MKAVILAGGFGTRISEESAVRPKPMVEIGGRPILWHILKIYSAHGINDFVIAAGYKGYMIKEYFANYFLHSSDVTIDLERNEVTTHVSSAEPWRITIVDTGEETMTGGRLRRLREYVEGERFCLTYGDCVADLDVTAEVAFHDASGGMATLTVVQPPGRFGAVNLASGSDQVTEYAEKPAGDGGWVNGGFFVVEPSALDYIGGDETIWEHEPLGRLADEGKLFAYRHRGFWHPMDTLRDRMTLEEMWAEKSAPWRVWG
ncbi:MAG: glucose-1-phosphate cytidylyltransferase [Actinobacteria bacterium]|nr:glucose-1-phosphate cytidylyltransferase [Actinomycetota bacterium]